MKKNIAICVFAFCFVFAVVFRVVSSGGVFIREVHPVNPGELLKVQIDIYRDYYVFGFRLPFNTREGRDVVGVTVHDLETGKLIGRYHDAGANICPRCNGVGEIDRGDQ